MEFTNNPRNPNPRPSVGGTPQQPLQRRVFNDFGVRPTRPAQHPGAHPPKPAPQPHAPKPISISVSVSGAGPSPVPQRQQIPISQPGFRHQPMLPHQSHHQPQHAPASQPHHSQTVVSQPPRPAAANPTPSSALRPADLPRIPLGETAQDEKMHKPNHRTTHAGLIGFVCFVLISGVLLSPLIPGAVLDNFPGNSQTESNGADALACATDLGQISTNTAYTLKLGSPIVYKYTRITTQKATCNNKAQSAEVARSAQFNPLGLLANLIIAAGVSFAISKIWHVIAGRKHEARAAQAARRTSFGRS